jgi:transcriptional regulator with XRE-family HTH domain
METKNGLVERIGNRLKILRKQRGMTLNEIAQQAHLSASLFSRIENGRTMPSIQTLRVIADVLKIDIGYFFHWESGKRYVVSRAGNHRLIRADRRSWKGSNPHGPLYDTELLADGVENPFMVPMILKIEKKNYKNNPPPHGGQEFLFVLEGKILVALGEEKIILKKGDTLYFDASIPHKGTSLRKKPSKVLAVHMVPGRRVRNILI